MTSSQPILDPVSYAPYTDPDAFIREVTDRIWIDRDIAHIEANYEPDSIVHGALGTVVGRDGVIQGSLMRIADTPYRVGQAEDVVWEARGTDAFLSSHLVLSADALVDPTTGIRRPLRARTVANCLYRRGRMVEEWVVRDTLAGVLQTGGDPAEAARSLTFVGWHGSMNDAAPGDVLAVGDSGERPDLYRSEAEQVLELVETVWNGRNLSAVKQLMIRDLVLQTVGDLTVTRPDGYQRDLLRLLAAFPAAQFRIRDVATNDDPRYGGVRVALTWILEGSYDGAAHYGPLTGAPVRVLGVSQFLVQGGRIVREVRVYDDLALRAQIDAARGDGPAPEPNIY